MNKSKLDILRDCNIQIDRLQEEKPLLLSNILKAMDEYYNYRTKKDEMINILRDCNIQIDRLQEEKPLLVSNILKAMDQYYIHRTKKDEMINILRWVSDSPYVVDSATVPKMGVNVAPEQVVVNVSLGWVIWQKIQKLMEGHKPLDLEETKELSDNWISEYKNNL